LTKIYSIILWNR